MAPGPAAVVRAQQNCTSIAGTIYGHLEADIPAWVGSALVSFGRGAAQRATFVTTPLGMDFDRFAAGKTFRGRERNTFTFEDGATFSIEGPFVGLPLSTPGLYTLNESAEITEGSGRLADVSGHVSVHGPFIWPLLDPRPLWIAEMHGSICGISGE
jgi:hypothetical protein